jgi:hypothetical protein
MFIMIHSVKTPVMSVRICNQQFLRHTIIRLLPLALMILLENPLFSQVTNRIVLTENDHTSRYRIVVPVSASPYERKAAEVLKQYLLEISGSALPVVRADQSQSNYEIVLGQNERVDESGLKVNLNDLGWIFRIILIP